MRPFMEEDAAGSGAGASPSADAARGSIAGRNPGGMRSSVEGGMPAGGPFAANPERRASAEMAMVNSGLSDALSLSETQRGSLRFLGTEVDQA